MPPVLKVQEEIEKVLQDEPLIEGTLSYNIIFTDISPSTNDRVNIYL